MDRNFLIVKAEHLRPKISKECVSSESAFLSHTEYKADNVNKV